MWEVFEHTVGLGLRVHAESPERLYEEATKGIIARARSRRRLAEKQPAAYQDVDIVVDIVHRATLSAKVARLRPLGMIKR